MHLPRGPNNITEGSIFIWRLSLLYSRSVFRTKTALRPFGLWLFRSKGQDPPLSFQIALTNSTNINCSHSISRVNILLYTLSQTGSLLRSHHTNMIGTFPKVDNVPWSMCHRPLMTLFLTKDLNIYFIIISSHTQLVLETHKNIPLRSVNVSIQI